MALREFTWSPKLDPKGSTSYRVLRAQFGDGYEQAVGDGINTETQSWALQFSGSESYIGPIRAFLRDHMGVLAFLWKPPLGELTTFVARKFEVTPHGGDLYSLAVTFDQRFVP